MYTMERKTTNWMLKIWGKWIQWKEKLQTEH